MGAAAMDRAPYIERTDNQISHNVHRLLFFRIDFSTSNTPIAQLVDYLEANHVPLDELRSDSRNSLIRREVIETSKAVTPTRRMCVVDGI